jgi:non-specific serine/threonine protein kinase
VARDDPGRRVRDALAHLHDLPYLQTHPLAARAGGGKALQRDLVDTIAALDGGRAGRLHRLLVLRYADALASPAVWTRLAISKSEYYHAHGRALAAVASVLAERWAAAPAGSAAGHRAPPGDRPSPPLPRALTSFVGRERELAEARRLLAVVALLTLTGPPGTGKTRLALELAAAAAGDFPDGVVFVPLAPVADPDLVLPAVAQALRIGEAPGRDAAESVARYLRDRTLLLVLDNVEQVVTAAPQAAELLARCRRLRVLATSREPLGVPGEQRFPVPPLPVPPEEDETGGAARLAAWPALRLFAERARAVSPGFAVTDENGAAVAGICRRLDGLPLAIELAAARVDVLPPAAMLARLRARLAPPTGGLRGVPPRHRTLRDAIDWSHDLLPEPERALLRRLAVFPGGWTLDAAEAVGAGDPVAPHDVLDLLARLADKSLVVADAPDGEGRYRLLETVRRYAEEKLGEAGEAVVARDRHRDWCLALSERFAAEYGGSAGWTAWLERLAAERDNMRAALEWSRGGGAGAAAGLRLAANLAKFWCNRWLLGEGGGDALAWIRTFLDLAPARTSTRGEALVQGALFARTVGDLAGALALAEEALALYREMADESGVSHAQAQIGLTLAEGGDQADARARLEESVALVRAAGRAPRLVDRLRDLGLVRMLAADHAGARDVLEESLALARELGSLPRVYRALLHLGNLERLAGDPDRARARFDECRAAAGRSVSEPEAAPGDDLDLRIGLVMLEAVQGDTGAAAAALRALLRSRQRRDGDPWTGTLLCVAGVVAILRGEPAPGVRLIAAGAAVNPRYATVHQPAVRLDVAAGLACARAALGEDAFAQAWSEGQATTLEQAIADALEGDGG